MPVGAAAATCWDGSTEKPGKLAVEAACAALLGDGAGAPDCSPWDAGFAAVAAE